MALQAWVGRSAAQLDADSPLDITLHNSYDDDLIHLRQVSYGDGAGGFRTPIDGHNHLSSGANSAPLVDLPANIVGSSQIAANSVTPTELKFTQGSWATVIGTVSYGSINVVEYSHYPQMKCDAVSSITVFGKDVGVYLGTSYAFQIWAYNIGGTGRTWSGLYQYHSASEQIIEVIKNIMDEIVGVHVTEKGNENSIAVYDKDGVEIPVTLEVLTIETNPELFISKTRKRAKQLAVDLIKTPEKLKITKAIT